MMKLESLHIGIIIYYSVEEIAQVRCNFFFFKLWLIST
jgi:hypothetical protein